MVNTKRLLVRQDAKDVKLDSLLPAPQLHVKVALLVSLVSPRVSALTAQMVSMKRLLVKQDVRGVKLDSLLQAPQLHVKVALLVSLVR